MNAMGISNGALARGVGVDRSYPGHVRRGRKLPSSETAELIRNHLLAEAEQPGWNGSRRLTVNDQQRMDELLRASFARGHTARRQTQPLSAPVTAQQPDPGADEDALAQYERGVRRMDPHTLERIIEELRLDKEDAARLLAAWAHDQPQSPSAEEAATTNAGEAPRAGDLDAISSLASVARSVESGAGGAHRPGLVPGGAELESLIAACGDNPTYQDEVRRLVRQTNLLAIGVAGRSVGPGGDIQVLPSGDLSMTPEMVYLVYCQVQVRQKTIFGRLKTSTVRILPVFTSVEHLFDAVHAEPTLAWQTQSPLSAWHLGGWDGRVVIQVVQGACLIHGSALIEDLGSHEWLGINLGSGHEFKLPPRAR